MPRVVYGEAEAINTDSFLDIVASVVSIMIIMVLMVGLRIKNMPVDLTASIPGEPPSEEAAKDVAVERSLRQDVLKTTAEIQRVGQEALVRKQQRDALALAVAAKEHNIEAKRQQLDAQGRQNFDLQRGLADAKFQLEQLDHQRTALENAPPEAIAVESFPTPLSHTVDGNELHFQLRNGRLAELPMARLVARFKSDAEHQIYKLRDRPEFTETTAPEGGFRARYTIVRHDVTGEEAAETHRRGAYPVLKILTFIPMSDDLGETVDEALRENSQFRLTLADARPASTTITIWTYPDGFDAFRRIKRELYRLGFATAARPLPQGKFISASPDGSKSAAE